MTDRERLLAGLSPGRREMGVREFAWPWDLTAKAWHRQGKIPLSAEEILTPAQPCVLNGNPTQEVYRYERLLPLDGVKRMSLINPANALGILGAEDWEARLGEMRRWMDRNLTPARIAQEFGVHQPGHARGEYLCELHLSGFFWHPRTIYGIEPHLYAFYDEPERMHRINRFLLEYYEAALPMILQAVDMDLLIFNEDLSGANGPMISGAFFDEFCGTYYRRLLPQLKALGLPYAFLDTDGKFQKLIPNMLAAGIDGFLPLDVNAGVDLPSLRRAYPQVRFLGGFNKLALVHGRQAIERELTRLRPVIASGAYLMTVDHQVPPDAPFENYLYYLHRARELARELAR